MFFYVYFNVNFNVFYKLIVHLLVSELYIYQNARCNDKNNQLVYFSFMMCLSTSSFVCFSHTQQFWKFFHLFLLDVSVSLSHPQVNYL